MWLRRSLRHMAAGQWTCRPFNAARSSACIGCLLETAYGPPGIVLLAHDLVRMQTRAAVPLVRPVVLLRLGTEHERMRPIVVMRRQSCGLNPFDPAMLGVHRLAAIVVPFGDKNDAKPRAHDAADIILQPF